jgi:hypothetical protein
VFQLPLRRRHKQFCRVEAIKPRTVLSYASPQPREADQLARLFIRLAIIVAVFCIVLIFVIDYFIMLARTR